MGGENIGALDTGCSPMDVGDSYGEAPGTGTGPTEVEVKSFPNPINPGVTISYRISEDSRISAGLFDHSGRLVKKLVDGEYRISGKHSVYWNGRNEQGKTVSSGIYCCRVQTHAGEGSTKIVVLK